MKKNHQLPSSTISIATTFCLHTYRRTTSKSFIYYETTTKIMRSIHFKHFLKIQKGQLLLFIKKKHSRINKNSSKKKGDKGKNTNKFRKSKIVKENFCSFYARKKTKKTMTH